jgi:hypothetical protein
MKNNEMGGACSTYGRRGKMHTELCWGGLRKKDHLEHLGLDVRIILKWIFKKWSGEAWTRWIWLRMETDGGLLSMG